MQNYQQGQRFFDEMFTPDGAVRSHYQGVQAYLDRLGVPEFERRHSPARSGFSQSGHYLYRIRRYAGHRAHLSL